MDDDKRLNDEAANALLEKISNLTEEQKKLRDLYQKRLGARPKADQYTDAELKHKEEVVNERNKILKKVEDSLNQLRNI